MPKNKFNKQYNFNKIFDLLPFLSDTEKQSFIETLSDKRLKVLRLNKFKISPADFEKDYLLEKFPYADYIYFLPQEKQFFFTHHPYYIAGLYYIQEPSSVLPVILSNICNTDVIFDLCASPGGKSTHIASLLTDGLLIANEVDSSRLRALKENIFSFSNPNVVITNNDVSIFNNLSCVADKVFIDAPCSALGTLRKATFWPNKSDVYRNVMIQKQLIDTAFNLLKYRGKLIYSTCTYTLEENEDIVRYAIENYNFSLINLPSLNHGIRGYELSETIRLRHYDSFGEGQFIAILEKNSGETHQLISKLYFPIIPFCISEFLLGLGCNFPEKYQLQIVNSTVFLIGKNPILPKINIISEGILIGHIIKNIFIPENILSTILRVPLSNTIVLDDKLLNSLLKGFSIPYDMFHGYKILNYKNINFAFAKCIDGYLRVSIENRFLL